MMYTYVNSMNVEEGSLLEIFLDQTDLVSGSEIQTSPLRFIGCDFRSRSRHSQDVIWL